MSDLKPLTYMTYVHRGDSVHVYCDSIARIKKGILCIYTDGYLVGSLTEWDYHRCTPMSESVNIEESDTPKEERPRYKFNKKSDDIDKFNAFIDEFIKGRDDFEAEFLEELNRIGFQVDSLSEFGFGLCRRLFAFKLATSGDNLPESEVKNENL